MRYIAPKLEGAMRPRAECNMSPWIPSTHDITNLYPAQPAKVYEHAHFGSYLATESNWQIQPSVSTKNTEQLLTIITYFSIQY